MTFAFGTRGNGANAIFAKTWESYPPCIWHWLTFKSEHILLRSSTPPLSMSFRYYCTVYIAHAHYLLSSYQVSWGPEIRAWAPSDTFATYTRTTKINTQIHRQTDTQTHGQTHTPKSTWIWIKIWNQRLGLIGYPIEASKTYLQMISITRTKVWNIFRTLYIHATGNRIDSWLYDLSKQASHLYLVLANLSAYSLSSINLFFASICRAGADVTSCTYPASSISADCHGGQTTNLVQPQTSKSKKKGFSPKTSFSRNECRTPKLKPWREMI